jgi:hypothetical protein
MSSAVMLCAGHAQLHGQKGIFPLWKLNSGQDSGLHMWGAVLRQGLTFCGRRD